MNRRQRRARQSSPTGFNSKILESADDIPLSRPPSDKNAKPKPAKTLLEIAAERQSALSPATKPFNPKAEAANIVNVRIGEDGNIVNDPPTSSRTVTEDETEAEAEAEATLRLDSLLLAISLSALHFTLEVLTVHQYAQELRFTPIVLHTLFIALPTLVLLVFLFHGHLVPLRLREAFTHQTTSKTETESTISARPSTAFLVFIAARQSLYLAIAVGSGCYLIQLTNDRGYYAVMKNAPSIGTLWVWAILELGLVGALIGVVGPGLYAWWNGYGIF